MNQQPSTANQPKPIESMSFEEALVELERIVKQLEAGGQALEASITHYERGTQLKAHCEKKLKEAQLKVEKIIGANDDGTLRKEPFGTGN